MNKQELEFLRSAVSDGHSISTNNVLDWIAEQNRLVDISIRRFGLDDMDSWGMSSSKKAIHHVSGRFFSIEGIRVTANWGERQEWDQPIINQPEIGYLGCIVKHIKGVLHFLLQAKIEPGNVNYVQLSPTIQATRSNYMQVHKGRKPLYLEYFQNAAPEDVMLDHLQSEQGDRFYKKRNRNIIVYAKKHVDVQRNFIWLTLKQIKDLMDVSNIVNMDTRTVISGVQFGEIGDTVEALDCFLKKETYEKYFLYSAMAAGNAVHSISEIISLLTRLKSECELTIENIALDKIRGWSLSNGEISHNEEKFFRVIGVDVRIGNREVQNWQQPMIEPTQRGVCAFVCKKINGIIHFAVQAKMECGNFDMIEMAPTVQCFMSDKDHLSNDRVPYFNYVLNARKDQIVFDSVQSEEGGRFFQEQNRYMAVMADELFPDRLEEGYVWMTLYQLLYFIRFNNYINIQARSIIAGIKLS